MKKMTQLTMPPAIPAAVEMRVCTFFGCASISQYFLYDGSSACIEDLTWSLYRRRACC